MQLSPSDFLRLDAGYYAQNSLFQVGVAKDSLPSLALSGREDILDIGCGSGELTHYLATLTSGLVFGVDPDQGMIDLAKSRFTSPQLSFQRSSGESLSLGRRFARITAFSVLHWARDAEEFLRGVKNHLAPGGRALLLTYPQESKYYQPLVRVLNKFPAWEQHHNFHSSQGYAQCATRVGFSSVQMKVEPGIAKYQDFAAFRSYVLGWLPLLASIPRPELEMFFAALSEELTTAGYQHAGGTIALPYDKLQLILQ